MRAKEKVVSQITTEEEKSAGKSKACLESEEPTSQWEYRHQQTSNLV